MASLRQRKPVIRNPPKHDYFWAKFFFGILFSVSLVNHVTISLVQNTPYMDEEFHIRQTQEYCKGNYQHWDGKITTLPGLYVIPSVFAMLYGSLFQCTPFILRSLNLVITSCIYWTFYQILLEKNPEMGEKKRGFMAYTLTLFPLNYFFTFLYYTDQLSTFLILLMSYLASKGRIFQSAASGAYAVFTRQTNIVWVFWMPFQLAWDILHADIPNWVKLMLSKIQNPGKEKDKTPNKKSRNSGNELSLVQANILFWSNCTVKIASTVMPYAVNGLCFIGFVVGNGGIVVGDRLAHQASINIPQLFYFAFFFGFMLSPVILISGPIATISKIKKHLLFFVSLIGFGLLVVHLNTVVHPYLLADNRHYTFYVWKRLYEWYGISRYVLVPFYVILWFWIWANVQWDPVRFIGFLICFAATVVPQKLLEYRYFIIPFYILRLNIKHTEWKYLIPECTFYSLINIFTIYQFLMNPFVLEGKTEISRFMW